MEYLSNTYMMFEGTSSASSSESPSSATPSEPLIGHASFEIDSDREGNFTPPEYFVSTASSSSPSTPGIDSSPNNGEIQMVGKVRFGKEDEIISEAQMCQIDLDTFAMVEAIM